MRKAFLWCGLVVVLCIVTSCDLGVFETNFFSDFEKYKKPNVQESSSEQLVQAARDSRFIENLTSEEVEQVTQKLEITYQDTTAPESNRVDSALLVAEVEIRTSGVEETIEIANGLAADVVEGEQIDFEEPEFLEQIFPENDRAQIKTQLKALSDVSNALNTYGTLIAEDNSERETLIERDENPGDTAVKAIMSGLVAAVVEENGDDDAALDTIAEAIVSRDFSTINLPQPTTQADASPEDKLLAFLGGDEKAQNLLNVVVAGVDLSSFAF